MSNENQYNTVVVEAPKAPRMYLHQLRSVSYLAVWTRWWGHCSSAFASSWINPWRCRRRMRCVVVDVSCNVNPNVMFFVDDDDDNVVISTMIVSSWLTLLLIQNVGGRHQHFRSSKKTLILLLIFFLSKTHMEWMEHSIQTLALRIANYFSPFTSYYNWTRFAWFKRWWRIIATTVIITRHGGCA